MSPLQETVLEWWALLAMTVLVGLLVLGLWSLLARNHQHLYPPQRHRAVTWTGAETIVVFVMALYGVPALVWAVLLQTEFFHALYGPDFAVPTSIEELSNLPALGHVRLGIWVGLFAFPFQVAVVPGLLWLARRTRPYQLGLTTRRAAGSILLACLFWLALTPVVYGLNFLVSWLDIKFHGSPEEHPLSKLARQHLMPVEVAVLTLTAVFIAPALEELLFRGLLQTWFASRLWGGHLAMTAAVGMAYIEGREKAGIWPAVFALATIPGFLYLDRAPWRWLPEPKAARAIYGTSLLFGVFHANVWPTPIPLFILALGLGYLAYRTQSLVGPVVLHALFNAVASASFFFYSPAPEPDPSAATPHADVGAIHAPAGRGAWSAERPGVEQRGVSLACLPDGSHDPYQVSPLRQTTGHQ